MVPPQVIASLPDALHGLLVRGRRCLVYKLHRFYNFLGVEEMGLNAILERFAVPCLRHLDSEIHALESSASSSPASLQRTSASLVAPISSAPVAPTAAPAPSGPSLQLAELRRQRQAMIDFLVVEFKPSQMPDLKQQLEAFAFVPASAMHSAVPQVGGERLSHRPAHLVCAKDLFDPRNPVLLNVFSREPVFPAPTFSALPTALDFLVKIGTCRHLSFLAPIAGQY